jgi:4-hydroxybenzoate polyprenyltransferase
MLALILSGWLGAAAAVWLLWPHGIVIALLSAPIGASVFAGIMAIFLAIRRRKRPADREATDTGVSVASLRWIAEIGRKRIGDAPVQRPEHDQSKKAAGKR